jgi:hypothetical protein
MSSSEASFYSARSQAPAEQAHSPEHSAHAALIVDSQRVTPRADLLRATAYQAAFVGAATAATFGAGRTSGQVGTKQGARRIGAGAATGPAPDSAAEVVVQLAKDLLVHLGTTAAGAAINTAAPLTLLPAANLIGLKFARNSASDVVPDSSVEGLNTLVPGAGTALRAEAAHKQTAADSLASNSSIASGEVAFDLMNAVRGAAVGAAELGPIAAFGTGTLVSALGGAGTGLGMAYQQATATLQVPSPQAIERAVQRADIEQLDSSARQQLLSELLAHGNDLKLFAVKPTASTLAAFQAAWANSPHRVPRPAAAPELQRSMSERASALFLTMGNVARAVGDRFLRLNEATIITDAVLALAPRALTGADANGARVLAAVANSVAIHPAVPRWFVKLGEIAAHDAARLSANQRTADQRHAATLAAPTSATAAANV